MENYIDYKEEETTKRGSFLSLVICIALPIVVGLLSSMVVGDMASKYAKMNTPPLSPPAKIFPIVWMVLYVMMGIASYIVYQSDSKYRGLFLFIYAIQLIFNFAWSPIFFLSGTYWAGFIWLVTMIVIIYIMMILARNASKIAFAMFVPYLAWCLFAAYLNAGVAILT